MVLLLITAAWEGRAETHWEDEKQDEDEGEDSTGDTGGEDSMEGSSEGMGSSVEDGVEGVEGRTQELEDTESYAPQPLRRTQSDPR